MFLLFKLQTHINRSFRGLFPEFQYLSVHQKAPGRLVKYWAPLPESLIQSVLGGAQDFAFLTSSPVLLMLRVLGPHFENLCNRSSWWPLGLYPLVTFDVCDTNVVKINALKKWRSHYILVYSTRSCPKCPPTHSSSSAALPPWWRWKGPENRGRMVHPLWDHSWHFAAPGKSMASACFPRVN